MKTQVYDMSHSLVDEDGKLEVKVGKLSISDARVVSLNVPLPGPLLLKVSSNGKIEPGIGYRIGSEDYGGVAKLTAPIDISHGTLGLTATAGLRLQEASIETSAAVNASGRFGVGGRRILFDFWGEYWRLSNPMGTPYYP